MKTLLKNISSLVTVDAGGKTEKAGAAMNEVSEISGGAMLFGENIEWIGTSAEAKELLRTGKIKADKELDMNGKTVLPGFVDSHTHIVFAGDRTSEFGRRLRGVSYKQIADEGGGILTTMKATRQASIEELYAMGLKLAKNAIRHGATALEVKSGYGLSLESELNQLRAIKMLKETLPIHISATFLGAHDMPPEYKSDRQKYIDIIINEMIPQVADEKLAEYCDVFIDKGFFTIDEGRQIMQAGLDAGMKLKIHADELFDTGSAKLAADMGAISADHLLNISDEGIKALAKAKTVATLLPGTAYFIRMPYAPARKLIAADAIVALSTDTNPGSSFTENMQLIMSLAAINMHMTAEECISAATLNGAKAIEQSHRLGSLEVGKQADFIVMDTVSYIEIFYHFGINHVESTWAKGKLICKNSLECDF